MSNKISPAEYSFTLHAFNYYLVNIDISSEREFTNTLKKKQNTNLFNFACMLICFSCVRLFVTPWTAAHQAPLSIAFPRQEYWSGCCFLLQGNLPDPGIEPMSPEAPALQADSFSSVQSLSRVQLFATPWTAARQASLFIINCQSLLKLISIQSVVSSNHLILWHPLFLLPSIFPSIRVFSNESVLHLRLPKY